MKSGLLLIAAMAAFATGCGQEAETPSLVRSLTGDDYAGTKHYFGWGVAARNDPQMMHNEVMYDVLHTHDIFTDRVGGDYVGTKEIGVQVTGTTVQNQWNRLRSTVGPEDMYVQYSSGHGYQSGLAIGVSYNQMRDAALALPAKEIVVFTMACYSGNLVDSFNNARSRWADFEAQGRTLFVMASSPRNQTSATGPGRDPDQPGGPNGSAGSAFGHALWKSLIGYADGYVDGVKDGYISLEEIAEYTKWKTQSVGRHMPQITGVYNGNVLMNRVPPRSFLAQLDRSTEGLSDEEIAARVQALDSAFRLN